MEKATELTFGSLFTGIGGFDLGLERAGWKAKWQVEIKEARNRVLERHWPEVRRYRDVQEVGSAALEPVGLICGGFPCQDLSVAGKRAGLAGERSGLFFEFARIITEIRPLWVVIENVPGLLSSNEGRDMGTVLGTLAKLGYGYAYRVLDAQYFGVAQRRRRVFIVGHLGTPWSAPAKVLFESESCSGDTPPHRETGKVAATLPASGAGTSRTGNEWTEVDLLVAHSLTTRPGGRMEPSSETYVIQDATLNGKGLYEGDTIINTLRAKAGAPKHQADESKLVVFVQNQRNENRRMAVRRLALLECERLQAFPDNWTAQESDSARYAMLGDAVVSLVAEWIGRRIADIERGLYGEAKL